MKRTTIFVIALLIGLFSVGTALAHASLVSSTPEDGATLDAIPETITLVFNEELSDTSGFTVIDASGATVSEGTLDLNDLERSTLSGTLPTSIANGAYTVNWVAISSDDDNREEGAISFTLALAQPTVEPTTEPTPVPTSALTAVSTSEPTTAPTTAPPTATAVEPTVLIIDSPTNPGGPTRVDDDGARIGRMIALIVALVTVVGITAAAVLTRRRGREQ